MSTSILMRHRIETTFSLLEMQGQVEALESGFTQIINDKSLSELIRIEASVDAHLLRSLKLFMDSHIKRFQAVSK